MVLHYVLPRIEFRGCLGFVFPSLITLFPSPIAQKQWDTWLRSVFGIVSNFCFIIQFSDFWMMRYRNWKHILGVFKLWKQSYNGILIIKHSYIGPTSLVKSDSLLSTTSNSLFSFFLSFFLSSPISTFLSFSLLLYLFFFLFFFKAKYHPKTKEYQPSPSMASLLQSTCPHWPTPTHSIDPHRPIWWLD